MRVSACGVSQHNPRKPRATPGAFFFSGIGGLADHGAGETGMAFLSAQPPPVMS